MATKERCLALTKDDDGEAVPRNLIPTPMTLYSHDLRTMLDPTLCLTPDKTPKSTSKSGMGSTDVTEAGSFAPASPKVRFESQVTVQFLPVDDEIQDGIIDIDRSDDAEQELSFSEPLGGTADGNSLGDEEDTSRLPTEYHYQMYSGDPDQEVRRIISGTESLKLRGESSSSHLSQPPINVDNDVTVGKAAIATREVSECSSLGVPTSNDTESIIDVLPQKMAAEKASLMATGDSEHILARPELNTTLYASKEVCRMADQERKLAMAAAKAKLENSARVRTVVEEKAYSHLNAKEVQFPGLVGISLEEEDLVASAAREMASKVKPAYKVKAARPEDQVAKPPDIMEFFTPDLQREVPSFTLHGIPALPKSLCTADQQSAFDTYRHIRAWENW